jgi:hypothetical protein
MCYSEIVQWATDEIEPLKVVKRLEINSTLLLIFSFCKNQKKHWIEIRLKINWKYTLNYITVYLLYNGSAT